MSIDQFYSEYVDWAAAAPAKHQFLTTFTSMNRSGIAGFGRGSLVYSTTAGGGGPYMAKLPTASLQGTFEVLFSDRQYAPPGDGMNFIRHPFDPLAADKMAIRINLGAVRLLATPKAPTMTVTLLSWGNTKIQFPLEYREGVLYGVVDAWDTLFAFGLVKHEVQTPK